MQGFETIYTQYSPQIFRVCMGYVNDAEQAKDLTQETFISVWKNLDSFRHESKISTWIYRIATNNCLRAIEVGKRMIKTELPLHLPDLPDESPEEKLRFLYQAISELEETERIIISLLLEDLPQGEIADIVGLNPGTVRVRIHRIKEKLAIKFREHGQFE
ncbi:RNA polymerase sigma factor [Mucilaginibacter sp. HD30]